MTTEPLRKGDVFYYPYLWLWQRDDGIPHGKDRTCCLAFTFSTRESEQLLIVIAISESKTGMALEIPVFERKLAGLRADRPAFLHLDEYNIDPLVSSFDRHPKPRVLGRFSRQFMNRVTQQFAINIKAGRSKGNDRRQ